MCSWRDLISARALLTSALLLAAPWVAAQSVGASSFPGLGRAATPQEVAAWDIDVRPDFKGLPAGSGSVAQGQDLWESKCAHCHGVFGESNEVFSPLIGGTTAEDIKNGRVANLSRTDYPGRTTIMKVATVSTLWDYINRAMPWTAPKSLKPNEVYALTAYLLNLAHVVPDNFTLSNHNIAQVQQRMPNRNGMTTAHALWPGKEMNGLAQPDTKNVACMKDCATEVKVSSFLPEHVRNAHGNLAEQNRLVGAQRGADTTRPESRTAVGTGAAADLATTTVSSKAEVKSDPAAAEKKAALALIQKHSCTACHGIDRKLVGPAFQEVAKKHGGKVDYLAGKIKAGGSGVWGAVPMPAQTLSDADAKAIAQWIAQGAAK